MSLNMATMAKMFSPAPARQPRYPWFRLDMLMDGIFAIAATLLVLDLKVPANLRPGHLGTALLHLWPEYLVYALGFLQIMAGWLSTRRISAWTKNVDHYATVGMLLGIGMFTLTPFTTAVLAASIHNRADFGSAARLYALVLIVTLLLVGSTAFYLDRRGFVRDSLDPGRFRLASLLMYTAWLWPAAALLLSYASPQASVSVLAAYFLLNLWPFDAMSTEGYAGAE
jgi:uncharacterized membrane protein